MTDGSFADVLRAISAALEAANIPFMVVGSFASMAHGAPRTTYDLDLVIDPSRASLESLLASLSPDRFYVDADVARDAYARRSMFNVIDMQSAWKIDLVVRKDRVFSTTELARRAPMTIADLRVPTATAEDTIIAKLEWAKAGSSERQLADVAGLIRSQRHLNRAYLDYWVDELGLRAQWDAAASMADSK